MFITPSHVGMSSSTTTVTVNKFANEEKSHVYTAVYAREFAHTLVLLPFIDININTKVGLHICMRKRKKSILHLNE